MARRKAKRSRSRKSKKVSIATTAGAFIGAANVITPVMAQPDLKTKMIAAGEYLTGFNPNVAGYANQETLKNAAGTWVPVIGGAVISKLGAKFGVNKYINAIPIVGQYLKV